MNNLSRVSVLSFVAIATLNAGQIQIGNGGNGASGLTATYVSPNVGGGASTTSCAGASNALSVGTNGYNNCAVPPTSGTALFERTYQATLFSNAVPSPTVPVSPLSGGGATFARVGDTGFDMWITNPASKATAQTLIASSNIVIAVGVYGVDKIWTMLNDYWGADGLVNTTVDFTFDDSSNGTGGTTAAVTESIALTNGQQIRSAIDSAGSTAKTCLTTYTDATTGTCTSPGSTIATSLGAATTIGNAAVSAGNVFSSSYSSAPGANGGRQYTGTTGTIALDYQLFDFGALHTNDFLVSITIKSQLAGAQSGSATNQTRVGLSAITVNQVVPEPGTIILSLAGLGALGYFRRRRKA
jgi:hypothetical protein